MRPQSSATLTGVLEVDDVALGGPREAFDLAPEHLDDPPLTGGGGALDREGEPIYGIVGPVHLPVHVGEIGRICRGNVVPEEGVEPEKCARNTRNSRRLTSESTIPS